MQSPRPAPALSKEDRPRALADANRIVRDPATAATQTRSTRAWAWALLMSERGHRVDLLRMIGPVRASAYAAGGPT